MFRLDDGTRLGGEVEDEGVGVRGDDVPGARHPRPRPGLEEDAAYGRFRGSWGNVGQQVVLGGLVVEDALGDALEFVAEELHVPVVDHRLRAGHVVPERLDELPERLPVASGEESLGPGQGGQVGVVFAAVGHTSTLYTHRLPRTDRIRGRGYCSTTFWSTRKGGSGSAGDRCPHVTSTRSRDYVGVCTIFTSRGAPYTTLSRLSEGYSDHMSLWTQTQPVMRDRLPARSWVELNHVSRRCPARAFGALLLGPPDPIRRLGEILSRFFLRRSRRGGRVGFHFSRENATPQT